MNQADYIAARLATWELIGARTHDSLSSDKTNVLTQHTLDELGDKLPLSRIMYGLVENACWLVELLAMTIDTTPADLIQALRQVMEDFEGFEGP